MKRDAVRALERYNQMRDFDVTEEPSGRTGPVKEGFSYVVQKHDATRLHYDFRLELDGVLLSWAVPKGPSLSPADKRLAVQTEDHPIDYRDFEGTIPDGQYGGGPVIVWDRGTWTPIGDPRAGMTKGRLDFSLDGQKLHGRFVLVRTHREEKKPTWLLIKRDDAHARRDDTSIVDQEPQSILTGRTIQDILEGVPAKKIAMKRPAKKTASRKCAATTRAAKERATSAAKLPDAVAPQLATLVREVPTSGEWIFEIKYDGYRTMAWLEDGQVRLLSRGGLDWTTKYRPIAKALSGVRAKNAVFDGEVAYVLPDGRTDFQKLQNTLGGDRAEDHARLVYFVFDLLHYDGVDLRKEPLSFRKQKLRTILAGERPPLKLSDHVDDGASFFREACKLDLEGIIGKRADRPYHSGRSPDWIKVKCDKRQEFVIVGYTPPKGGRKGLGALLVALREGKKLRYAGKVGTGFSSATLKDLLSRLTPLVTDKPPVVNAPRMREAVWVEPELVGQVRFSEWTIDGVLRHPSFQGLRLDRAAGDVAKEKPASTPTAKPRVGDVVVTHPERVMDEKSGLTKLDLVRYAGAVADVMLPFVVKRPLMLLRCPGGIRTSVFRQSDRRAGKKSSCFVQKHGGQGLHAANLGSAMLAGEEALYVKNADDIVVLAQNNTVEVHGWGSTLPKWQSPDWIVLDLDPDETLPFERVVDAAFEMRDALATLSLTSWVKTTGGKGLHVVVPLLRRYDWETVRRVSQHIAVLMTQAAPSRYVANMSKKARVGKIFVDYLRNAEGATAVLPYSARARPGMPVALPVGWKDLRAVDPEEITIVTVPKLLARRRHDPWEDLFANPQTLPKALVALR